MVVIVLMHDGDAIGGEVVDGGKAMQGEIAVAVDFENRYVRNSAIGVDHGCHTVAIGDIQKRCQGQFPTAERLRE